ncbi:hypothetical protein APR04_004290 [Promicromonospora umidemergens]|uniref:Uncharacterized protein n=1 Tax=Promicromonospora umidemergens TaxID=629679 RepID=A0ABP8XRG0_9MICO|nr:hypothetical protein [Promicromonospora umidemergens]MCP2285358.1 hypothetical protein [Promicromonospora umidemergens]
MLRQGTRYCDRACRQADYRARKDADLPPEVCRELERDPSNLRDFGFEAPGELWYGRQLVRVVYARATPCRICGSAREQLWLLSRSRGIGDDFGPIDSENCLDDARYARRD